MEVTRKCSYCKTVKPHSEFVKNKKDKHGVSYCCYACKKKSNSKMLEKIFCHTCNIHITKLHYKDHTKSKMHEILLQLNKHSLSREVTVC